MICLKEKYAKKIKKQKDKKNALNMIASMYSRRCERYKMYLEGDSPYQAVITCIQLCNLTMFFHTQHSTFLATLDTCAGTMRFDHHKVLHMLIYAH